MITSPIKKRTWFIYTLYFTGMCLAVYSYFAYTKTSFIWQGDGLSQHYLLFYDYSAKIQQLFQGKEFDSWDWSIGMGADTLTSYGYYVVGDPFVYIGALFPSFLREFAYHLLLLLRLWCIGGSFLFYARKMDFSHGAGLIGAIMYGFSHYAIYNVTRHPFFLLPLIWYPLLCLGVEKILRKESATLFSVMVAVCAIANFYFFYKLTLLVFLYGIIRYGYLYGFRPWKQTFQTIGQCLFHYGIGLLLSAVLFLPMVGGFLSSSRSPEGAPINLLYYPLEYYGMLVINFLTPGTMFWTVGGFSVFAFFSLFYLWKKREKNRFLLTSLLVLGIFTLFPIFGSIMNGFAGPYNRFTFVIPFFLALASGRLLEERESLTRKDLIIMGSGLLFFTVVYVVAMISFGDVLVFLLPLLIGWSMWGLMMWEVTSKSKNITALLISLVAVNMAANTMAFYYPIGKNAMADMLAYGEAEESYANLFGGTERYLTENYWYRVGVTSQDNQVKNQFIYLEMMGLNSYLSLTDGDLASFSEEMEASTFQLIQPLRNGFDDRRIVNHLLGVRYILTDKKNADYLPYGYDIIQGETSESPYVIAETKDAYPFAFVENTWLPYSQFTALNPVEKEAFLAKGVVLADGTEVEGMALFKGELPVKKVPFQIENKENILEITDTSFEVSEEDGYFDLKVENPAELIGKELFVHLEGLHYQAEKKNTTFTQDDTSYWVRVKLGDKEKRIAQSDQYSFSSYFYRENMLFHMGYVDQDQSRIRIQFDDTGFYGVEQISLYALAVNSEEDQQIAAQKRANALEVKTFENDLVEGVINQENPGLLVLSIPYSTGWEVAVNGVRTETVKTNIGFTGVPIPKGESKVVLTYHSPLLGAGMALSLLGALLLGASVIIRKIKKKS